LIHTLACQIKQRREQLQLTQEALAEASELHPNMIGKLERGEVNPSMSVLWKLSAGLKWRLSELLAQCEL
jgi:transcriptional regulator with XRE-family HTH domain